MTNIQKSLLLAAALLLPVPEAFAADAKRIKLAPDQPSRIGAHIMDRVGDKNKALAMADNAGWTVSSDLLIGAFSNEWVGAVSLDFQKVSWWHKTPAPLTSPPTSFGNFVMVGYRNGSIAKLEATTGKQLWTTNLDSQSTLPFALSGTNLLVLTSAQVLYAIDFQTGKTLWLFDGGFPDKLTIRTAAPLVVQGNRIFVGVASGEILAVNLSSGKLIWRYNPSYNDSRFHDIVGQIAIHKSLLLIGRYDGLVAAIDLGPQERRVVWQEKLTAITTTAYRDGRYYIATITGDIYAFDANTGKRSWRTATGAAVSSITAGESELYIAGTNGRITSLDIVGGKIVWHDDIGGDVASKPIIFQNGIYFATGLKNIYGYKM